MSNPGTRGVIVDCRDKNLTNLERVNESRSVTLRAECLGSRLRKNYHWRTYATSSKDIARPSRRAEVEAGSPSRSRVASAAASSSWSIWA